MSTLPPIGPQEPERDEALARVRAAAPDVDADLDLPVLKAAVDARRAAPDGAAGPVDQLAARRARRTWLPVAAAAAGALVLGTGGGVAIGAGLGSDRSASGTDLLVAADDRGSGSSPMEGAVPGMAPGMAQSEAAGGADRAMSYWGYGRTVFTASGLSTEGGSATAYGLDARGAFTADTMARVAAALGVAGSPVQQDGAWLVGSNDGSSASLWMYPDGTASVSYYNPGVDPWYCADAGAPDGGTSSDAGTGEVMPLPAPVCDDKARDLGAAPQGADLEAAMRSVLGSIGVDADSYEIVAEPAYDQSWAYVTAHQLLDGKRSGLTWSGSWTGGGLQSLYGSLAALVSLGDYPVISPAAAVERLNDPRFGASGGPIAYADGLARAEGMEGDVATSDVPDAPKATVPPVASPGSPIAWPVANVAIVSAELILSAQYAQDGTVVVAPTYQLTGDDGSVWSVIAVADSGLSFS
ncbi:MAG TPA: hypothetical protein PKB06_10025 [Actinotalea sp.]|nr:hypothetical protein [Actinotalea sp.]